MVIIHLSGGFGNQLFSYAFGLAMARERQDRLAIDTAIQDQDWFFRNPDILNLKIEYEERITYAIRRDILSRGLVNKVRFRHNIGWHTDVVREGSIEGFLQEYYEKTKDKKDIYLKGNWGSVRFFNTVSDDIRKMYIFEKPLAEQAQKLENEMRSNPKSVTLHYRRGDYVKLGACMRAEYFIAGMRYIAERIENPVFYCFSEELEWVREQFRELPYQIKYMEYESKDKGMEDFRLLQSGYHQIISNSSYSWWAAYLNPNPEKIIVSPIIWDSEFCLPEWKGLPCEMIRG